MFDISAKPVTLRTVALLCVFAVDACNPMRAVELEIAAFKIDATPPAGSPLCDALVPPATGVDDPLSARGIILLPADEQAIVLVAVDWVGIGNSGQDEWKKSLAKAADTDVERVCVHTLHQHDAPGCDFSAEQIAAEHGMIGKIFPVEFARETIERVSDAVVAALKKRRRVTHVGAEQAKVQKVASNRRLLGNDGKVQHTRWSKSSDPEVRALPEGTIDPWVKVVSFWEDNEPIVVLSYYATHPQSYYGTGKVSADFPGLARSLREEQLPGVLHIHFNGAGGNITAGKYNDGSPKNRAILAGRLAVGMKVAWDATEKTDIGPLQLDWETRKVKLPPAQWLNEEDCLAQITEAKASILARATASRQLTWLRRCQAGHRITIGRLRLGKIDLLHLPGELFVEYQLTAQNMRPEGFVCTAAYGDYGPGYIGLSASYIQGGYETGPVSKVSPRAETVLMTAISELLQ